MPWIVVVPSPLLAPGDLVSCRGASLGRRIVCRLSYTLALRFANRRLGFLLILTAWIRVICRWEISCLANRIDPANFLALA
jgi:hypothetical protein